MPETSRRTVDVLRVALIPSIPLTRLQKRSILIEPFLSSTICLSPYTDRSLATLQSNVVQDADTGKRRMFLKAPNARDRNVLTSLWDKDMEGMEKKSN